MSVDRVQQQAYFSARLFESALTFAGKVNFDQALGEIFQRGNRLEQMTQKMITGPNDNWSSR
jgi:hypothetical protein